MSLNTMHGLHAAVLNWLGQPDDPLVAPHIPDMVRLFEAEATRRLRTRWREASAVLTPVPDEVLVPLPLDFHTLRAIRLRGNPDVNYTYLPPDQMTASRGQHYTIEGLNLRLAAAAGDDLLVTYQQGLTPLGPTVLTNWLLANHPDAYLFGVLVEAEAFVMNDERAPAWLARREAAFASVMAADAKARVGGGKLVIRAENVFPIGVAV